MELLEVPMGTFEFHELYMVSEIAEGVHFEYEDAHVVEEYARKYYQGRPFGYISRRKNSSSINPLVYIEHPPCELLGMVSFAAVVYRAVSEYSAQVEKALSACGGRIQYEIFYDFDQAEQWTIGLVNQARCLAAE